MTPPAVPGPLPRRAFLSTLAAAVCVAATGGLERLAALTLPRAAGRERPWWDGIWSDERSACAIGAACVAALRDARDAPALAAAVAAHVPAVASPSRARRRAAIAARVRRDFAEGRTVWVSGWLLSETETRLCALTALTHASSNAAT